MPVRTLSIAIIMTVLSNLVVLPALIDLREARLGRRGRQNPLNPDERASRD